jgi:hypothetical protein
VNPALRMVAIIQRVILPLLGMVPLVLPVQAGSNLLENSPFLPPNISAGAAQEVTPLELRSVQIGRASCRERV